MSRLAVVSVLIGLIACSTQEPTTPATSPPRPAGDAHAADDHAHDAPHGGIVQTVGDMHVEALMMPAGVMFYLSDGQQQALAVDGYSGSAVVKGPSGVTTVELMSMGDHLHAAAALVQGQPASVVLTLTHGGKAVGASWETQAVGLQSHDHTALHGGQVSMWGSYHLEYLPKEGEYRVWVTDEHRNPVAGPVTGNVTVGDAKLALTQDASGMLSAEGDGAGAQPVMVDVTVGETSFSLGFNAVTP